MNREKLANEFHFTRKEKECLEKVNGTRKQKGDLGPDEGLDEHLFCSIWC